MLFVFCGWVGCGGWGWGVFGGEGGGGVGSMGKRGIGRKGPLVLCGDGWVVLVLMKYG